ncbi:MAG: HD domain-containing protein [Acidobacteria bacterium]|nr:HD domain-containing protein [Acidobacteriota bacterium]MBI3655238.1 HD domain-containing protein [Acidobacteriota bacterium]
MTRMAAPKVFIRDLQANQEVTTTFLVLKKEIKVKKNGGQYLMFTLSDRSGSMTAFLWENIGDFLDTCEPGNFVLAKAMVKEFNSHLQLSLFKIKRVADAEIVIADYLPASDKDLDAEFDEIIGIILGFSNPYLKDLLINLFNDESLTRKFKTCPAGKTLHHAYIGGLMEHVLSIIRLAQYMKQHYPILNLDLLITGAILHDLGKVDELSYSRTFDYTDDGKLIGHLTMEVMLVDRKMNEISEFPEELRKQVLHMLLSHHGKFEYGSPKLPMTLEALVLHYLDNLDAKVYAMQWLIENDDTGNDRWTGYSKMFDGYIYKKRVP